MFTKSLYTWCKENKREDLLARWNVELNKCTPDQVGANSNKGGGSTAIRTANILQKKSYPIILLVPTAELHVSNVLLLDSGV